MDDFTESQKKFMAELFTKLNTTIIEKTSEVKADLKSQIDEFKADFASVIKKCHDKIDELKKDNKSLQKDILFLQRKARKNNIIIFGIDKREPNVLKNIISLFNDLLEVPVTVNDINDAYRVNSRINRNKEPPVVVEFHSFQQKLTVLKSAKKLKGKNIYIANDQCPEDREKHKILLQHQKLARNKGKIAYIRGDKLIIENDAYNVDQLSTNKLEEGAIETPDKSDSAPSTPNPTGRQNRLLQELGLEEEKPEQKRTKIIQHTPKNNTEDSTKIQTRSTGALKKK